MKKTVDQLKAVGLAAVITMVFCAGAQSAVIASFDVQGTNDANQPTTQTGYTALTVGGATGLGSATVNGITVSITQAVGARTRDPNASWFASNPGDPEWDLYRDFSYGGTMKVTISGLSANTEYDFRWYHYDTHFGFSQTMSVYQDEATGTPLFTAYYDIGTDPHTTGNSLFTATSDGTGAIDLVTSDASRLNGLVVIPEPATFGIVLSVLAAAVIRRRRFG